MSGNGEEEKLAQKRALVTAKGKNYRNFALMAFTLLMVVVAAYFFNGRDEVSPAQVKGTIAAGSATGDEVKTPASELQTEVARFYDYIASDGLKMRYFLVKTKDGVVRSALDACDSCWPAGKGYRQDGDVMVCNNCRMRFALEKIGEVKGGCNPSPIANRVAEGQVSVKRSDLEAGRKFFDLKN